MNCFRIFILIAVTLVLGACSKKDSSHSKVSIQFDESIFASKAHQLSLKPDGKTVRKSGPDWGVQNPTQITQIGCYAVFVGGPEDSLKQSFCELGSGQRFAFGPRAGFFNIRSKGSIQVPAGENRQIYLFGMASADGTCESDFAVNADIEAKNYSAPFLLGKARANLAKSEEVVEIRLQGDFSESNRITTCNFMEDKKLDIIGYDSDRKYWLASNEVPRTIRIEHEGQEVRCSRDGGSTFENCDTPSTLIWRQEDYNQQHVVQTRMQDGKSYFKTFTPSEVYPDIEWITAGCDHTISADDSINDVQSYFSSSSATLCIDPKVTISGILNAAINLGGDLVVISPQADDHSRARIDVTPMSTSSLFYFDPNFANAYFKMIGVDVEYSSSGEVLFYLYNASGAHDYYVYFDDSILTNRTGAEVLRARSSGGTNITHLKTFHSRFVSDDSSDPAIDIEQQQFDFTLIDSFIESDSEALTSRAGWFTMDGSEVFGSGDNGNDPTMSFYGGGSAEIRNSRIQGANSSALQMDCLGSGNFLNFNLFNTEIIREDDGTNGNGAAITINEPGCSISVNSNEDFADNLSLAHNNRICAIDGSTATYNSIFDTAPSGAGTFDPDQLSIGICDFSD